MERILVIASFGLFLFAIAKMLHRVQPNFFANLIASIKARPVDCKSFCPYCRESFGVSEELIRCTFCGSGHHAICWNQANGCTVFGCTGRLVNHEQR